MKSSLIVSILIALCQNLQAENLTAPQSFVVPIGVDSVKLMLAEWQAKLQQENVVSREVTSESQARSFFLTGRIPYLYTDPQIEIISISRDSTKISWIYQTYLAKKSSEIVAPLLNGTLRQSVNQPLDSGKNITEKSLGMYISLSALNVAAGGLYLKHNNFTFSPGPLLILLNGAGDVGSIAMMFSDSRSSRIIGISLFALYKGVALLQIPALNLHNKFAATGYQFEF